MYSSDEEFWSDEHESYSHFCKMPNCYNDYGNGKYCLANNNCEHYVKSVY